MVERVLFQANARTAMSVGQASGLALAAAAEAGIPVVQYSPNEVKQAVTGWGNAGKDQVQRMVQVLLDLPEKPCSPRQGGCPGAGALPPGQRAVGAGRCGRDGEPSRPRAPASGRTSTGTGPTPVGGRR